MRRSEAIEQVEYLRGLLRETHVQVAAFAPHLIWWGAVWVVGYIATIWIPWVWAVLVPVGTLGSGVLNTRFGRNATPMTPMLRRALVVNGMLWVGIIAAPIVLLAGLPPEARAGVRLGAYYPVMIGLMYAINGVLLELRQLVWLGSWLAVAGIASLGMSSAPVALVWLALSAGGAMAVSGLVLQRLPGGPAPRKRHLEAV